MIKLVLPCCSPSLTAIQQNCFNVGIENHKLCFYCKLSRLPNVFEQAFSWGVSTSRIRWLSLFLLFRAYHISMGVYPLLVEHQEGRQEVVDSLKCSVCRTSCSSTVLREFPCFSLIGFSSCSYLPDNFFVVAYSSL